MGIMLAKALLSDAVMITEINTNAYNDETNRFGPGRDGGPSGYNDIDVIVVLLSKYSCYKIFVEKEIIGWFWLHEHDSCTVELEDFCISPRHQNKGYGYETLLRMQELMPDKKKWILGTPYYSVRNQHLYEKAGYKKIGDSEDGFLFLYEKVIV